MPEGGAIVLYKFSALIALLTLIFTMACDEATDEGGDEAATAQPAAQVEVQTQSASLSLEGMTCVSCAAAIERALGDTEGVVSAKVDFGERRADVEYDGDLLEIGDLLAVIEEEGFEAQPSGE